MKSDLPEIDKMITEAINKVREIRDVDNLDMDLVNELLIKLSEKGLRLIGCAFHLGLLFIVRADCEISERKENEDRS